MPERVRLKRSATKTKTTPSSTRGKLLGTMQENVITLLCHRDEGREVAGLVDPDLFEGDYRVIAERAVEYWKRHDRPPGPHTVDLISDILEDKHNRRASTFRDIIVAMLDLNGSDKFNATFVKDNLHTFIRVQECKRLIQKSADMIMKNEQAALPELEEWWGEFLETRGSALVARPASDFKPGKTRWLDKPFLLYGDINLITGEGGVGKTLIALDMAADLSTRKKAKTTIFLTVEDDPGGDLLPRFDAAKGDTDKLLFLGQQDDDEFDLIDSLDTRGRMDEIEQIITERGDVGMVVIDPFVDFAGRGVNHYSEQDVRAALKPLRRLARRHGLAVVIVVHFNKKQDLSAAGRTSGSMAFRNVPRSVVLVMPDPDDPDRALIVQDKFNKLPRGSENAAAFTTKNIRGVPAIEWEDDLFRIDPDEMLQARQGRPSKQDAAKELLSSLLAKGPVSVSILEEKFKAERISWSTAKKVKTDMHVVSQKDGGRWYWELRGKSLGGKKGKV